jgi:hypothetical protein
MKLMKKSDKEIEQHCLNEDYEFVKYMYYIGNQLNNTSFIGKCKLLKKCISKEQDTTLDNNISDILYDFETHKFDKTIDYITPIFRQEESRTQIFFMFLTMVWLSNSKKMKIINEVYEKRTMVKSI